jgi:hypothetical protein
VVGATLGFAFTEIGGYLRRRRETTASALLVLHELTYAYIAAVQIRDGLIRKLEDLRVRRTAWEAHAPAIVRALTLNEGHLVGRAYARVDDLEPLLRAGVSGVSGDSEWFEENILADIRAGAMVVGKLAGQPFLDYDAHVPSRLIRAHEATGTD